MNFATYVLLLVVKLGLSFLKQHLDIRRTWKPTLFCVDSVAPEAPSVGGSRRWEGVSGAQRRRRPRLGRWAVWRLLWRWPKPQLPHLWRRGVSTPRVVAGTEREEALEPVLKQRTATKCPSCLLNFFSPYYRIQGRWVLTCQNPRLGSISTMCPQELPAVCLKNRLFLQKAAVLDSTPQKTALTCRRVRPSSDSESAGASGFHGNPHVYQQEPSCQFLPHESHSKGFCLFPLDKTDSDF